MNDQAALFPGTSPDVTEGTDLAELLGNIDQEIMQVALKYGDGLKKIAGDNQQELGRHICFDLGNRRLALPLSFVVEVGDLEDVRPLPFLPEWVQGVTNIRGEIVSVTDIALFFNIPTEQHKKKGRTFIIIYNGEVKTAVVVDRIAATRMLYKKEGAAQHDTEDDKGEQSGLSNFLLGSALYHTGEREEVVQLFDGEQLLSSIKIS
jgi:chemotaxis signal transduction protein